MPTCIYCEKEKPEDEMTLEHVIPQCIGGAYVPDNFKTDRVCQQCNNNLGLFVDAAFEKSHLISGWLKSIYPVDKIEDGLTDIPLFCMGKLKELPPFIGEDETCEYYVGPNGESVFWIRPENEAMNTYVGGDPIKTKRKGSTAYYFLSENSPDDCIAMLCSFNNSFKDKKVKRILAGKIDGFDIEKIGFAYPNDNQHHIVNFFRNLISDKNKVGCQVIVDPGFDFRFLAKLARGIGYCMWGNKALTGPYAAEIQKGIWYRSGPIPAINGRGTLSSPNSDLDHFLGHPDAVTITVMPTANKVSLSLNVGGKSTACIMCADDTMLSEQDFTELQHGFIFIMFRFLQKAIFMPLPDYLAHKIGKITFPELAKIEAELNS